MILPLHFGMLSTFSSLVVGQADMHFDAPLSMMMTMMTRRSGDGAFGNFSIPFEHA
jgi:hypothetical protein